MVTGLIHGHRGLAYLLVLSSTVSVVLALVNALQGSKPGLVKAGTVLGRRVEPALMGIVALIGGGAWVAAGFPLATPYLWAGVLALVLQGALVGMLTKPALVRLADGDAEARWRWVAAAVANVVIVYGIFGVMQAN
ncbi:MAG: hypothetical protein KC656_05165 [Myxococcales bacterium]|nr:hypothetical protein [Myxococcales bacterium]MCB9672947.1 hypothetical protein [Alphaproteobacteria bacterium]